MAVALTGVQETLVDAQGGQAITLVGSFEVAHPYRVYVGQNATGAPCYSGVSGRGPMCLPTDPNTLQVRLPAVAPGDVPLFVQDAQDNQSAVLSDVLRAETGFWPAQVFALRQDVRPILATGPTSPDQLPDANPVPGFV